MLFVWVALAGSVFCHKRIILTRLGESSLLKDTEDFIHYLRLHEYRQELAVPLFFTGATVLLIFHIMDQFGHEIMWTVLALGASVIILRL